MRNISLYVKDILEAIEAIEQFTDGVNFEDFKNNDMMSSAVIRKCEIIGEAARNIPEDIRKKYPNIPWKEMAGMRNILIHSYFGIKYDLVWNTIKKDLVNIKPMIRKLYDALKERHE